MLNFIKYEWLRRWKLFLAGIIVFLVADMDLVNRLITKESPNVFSVMLTAILFTLFAALVFDQLGRLYRSLFTHEGFMVLTLPLSGYQLLGAQVLAVVLECIAVMVYVGLVGYLDLMYVARTVPGWQLTPLPGGFFLQILKGGSLALGGYIIFILMIYLSLALAKSIFASFKYGKLIAFGCFLLIAKGIGYLGKLLRISGNYNCNIQWPNLTMATTDWLVIIVLIGILFTGTGYLLDKKIDL